MSERVIGSYRILEKIGAGGMGEVYRARDTRLDRIVALKILPEEVSRNPEALARFEREAKAVAALSHPNILAIHEFGQDDGVVFAAMELLEGQTLRERVQEGRVPLRKAVDIATQIADGLAAAHAQGIVHRDLKPGNVFLTRDGRVKILDFGLARIEPLQGGSQIATLQVDTAPGTILGTVGYMAPEQVRGEAIDARSDIFAFGALLHEMLTGQRAFRGDSAADVLGAILRDDPPEISQSDPTLPDSVGRIVQHCLEKNPEERFQSARDLRFALAASSSTSHSSLSVSPVPARRRRLAWIPILAVAGWALAGWLWMRGGSESEGTRTEPVSVRPWTYSGGDRNPAASPNGDRIAFVSRRDGLPCIWVKLVQGGGERPLTEGPDSVPRFSPDGSQLLFARRRTRGRDLYRIPTVGGSARKLVDDAQEGDWSPAGDRIAFCRVVNNPSSESRAAGTQVTEIRILDIRSGNETLLLSVPNLFLYGIRWSPDGAHLVISEASVAGNAVNTSALRLVDVATGDSRRVIPRGQSTAFTAAEWIQAGRLVVGQHASLLSAIGTPLSRVILLDVADETDINLFWATTNVPRGGFSFTTFAPIGHGRLVYDSYEAQQNLLRFDLQRPDTPTMLTNTQARDRQPIVSPDGRSVLFSSDRSGNLDLWVQNLETGELVQITDDDADDWDPGYTPDGDSIVWSSSRSGNLEVWMMNTDGSGARQVTRTGVNAENPTTTPDGTWIHYANSDPTQAGLWRIHPDGSGNERLFEGNINVPDTHPDGRWVTFTLTQNSGSTIMIMDTESGEAFEAARIDLLEGETANVLIGRSRWWPDGDSFIFVGADELGRSGIFRQDFVPGRNTDASRRRIGGFSADYAIETLSVTPDGSALILSSLFESQALQMVEGLSVAPLDRPQTTRSVR